MSNFKIGEKVVCVNPKNNMYKKNLEYIITNIRQCICGAVDINVNDLTESQYVCRCSKCNHYTLTPLSWNNSSRFRKLDHQFAEDICAELVKQVKEEQLILS